MDTIMNEFVVVTDLHGRLEHLREIVRRYAGATLISGGDVDDGPEYSQIAPTIDLLIEIGAVCVYGNHDFNRAAVMYETDPAAREAWLQVWQFNELRTLESYGLEGLKTSDLDEAREKADQLRDLVDRRGHGEYFRNLKTYFECGKFIVVHAGFHTGIPVDNQLQELERAQVQAKWGDYSGAPDQVLDTTTYKLAVSELGLPKDQSDKVLITGHFHNSMTPAERVTDEGRRVRLGSRYGNPNGPVHVWESWSGNVVPIHPNNQPYIQDFFQAA
ncbi:MAG: hypothetical protein Q7T41_02870 [Candidatus Saccharibacteria bacterium]|nr:hypothetical protein [Candidatus Saccharibacteria bacterium]